MREGKERTPDSKQAEERKKERASPQQNFLFGLHANTRLDFFCAKLNFVCASRLFSCPIGCRDFFRANSTIRNRGLLIYGQPLGPLGYVPSTQHGSCRHAGQRETKTQTTPAKRLQYQLSSGCMGHCTASQRLGLGAFTHAEAAQAISDVAINVKLP